MKKSRLLWAVFTGIGFLGLLLFLYKDFIVPAAARPKVVLERQEGEKTIWIEDGKKLTQEFQTESAYFEQVGIRFVPEQGKTPYLVKICLTEQGGELLQEWLVESTQLSAHGYTPLGMDIPVQDASGKTYVITVETEGLQGKGLKVQLAKKVEVSKLWVNGAQKKRDMAFVVRGGSAYEVRTMFFLLAAGGALFLGLLFVGIFRGWSVQRLFLPAGLLLGLLYLVGIPLMAGPDETRHGATAYSLSNIMLGLPAVNEEGRVPARAEDVPERYGMERIPDRDSLLRLWEGLGNRRLAEGEGTLRAPLGASRLLYLPQALGMTVARVAGLNGIWLYGLARLFGLLTYLGITYLAIRLLPFGKRMLFFVACLPMCMQQAAVITYDTMILAFSFLMIAHVLYLAYQKEQVQIWDWIPSMVCMAVLLPVKIVYVFLALLLILIPKEKYRIPFGNWLGIGAALLGGFLASAAVKATGAADILSRQSWTVPWGDEPAYTLTYVLQNPLETTGVFLNTLVELGKDYLGTMIGRYLCTYFDIRVDYWILWGFLLILILASLRGVREQAVFTVRQRWLFVLIFAATAGAACFSMLLAYTSIYSPVLQGVQGRYFLPALPVLLLAFRGEKLVWKEERDSILVWGMGVLQILTLVTVFLTIISR